LLAIVVVVLSARVTIFNATITSVHVDSDSYFNAKINKIDFMM